MTRGQKILAGIIAWVIVAVVLAVAVFGALVLFKAVFGTTTEKAHTPSEWRR